MTRRGFTLLEVMVALVVSGTVVLLAYATLSGGMDVDARVTRLQAEEQAMTIVRAMVSDAVRHATLDDGVGGVAGVRTERGADGRVRAVRLATRGIATPHGATAPWTLQLRTDSAGLRLDATPVQGPGAPLQVRVPVVRSLAIRFLAPAEVTWRDAWEDSTRLPAAIELGFRTATGAAVGAPVVVRTAAMERL